MGEIVEDCAPAVLSNCVAAVELAMGEALAVEGRKNVFVSSLSTMRVRSGAEVVVVVEVEVVEVVEVVEEPVDVDVDRADVAGDAEVGGGGG